MTAVEWLESEFIKLESTVGVYGIMYDLIEQAKAMEKEQMDKALTDRYTMGDLTFEEYYNKIYKTL